MSNAKPLAGEEFQEASILDAIYNRRAIRRYSTRKVEKPMIEGLLDAAIQAPSAVNSQPWAFVVIQQPELLKRISERSKELLKRDPAWSNAEHAGTHWTDPSFDLFYGATTLIVVCAKTGGFSPVGDCYLAAQNLMLAAYSMGMGSCPVGLARDCLRSAETKEELGIPAEYEPVLPIVVGFPFGIAQKTDRNPPRILNWLDGSAASRVRN